MIRYYPVNTIKYFEPEAAPPPLPDTHNDPVVKISVVDKPVNIECADCIYIDDFIEIVKNIVANWISGTYNISSNIIRDGKILQKVYPKYFIVNNKLGPTGQPRGTLDNSKLFKTFNVRLKFKSYEETIRDYYGKYENLCTQ